MYQHARKPVRAVFLQASSYQSDLTVNADTKSNQNILAWAKHLSQLHSFPTVAQMHSPPPPCYVMLILGRWPGSSTISSIILYTWITSPAQNIRHSLAVLLVNIYLRSPPVVNFTNGPLSVLLISVSKTLCAMETRRSRSHPASSVYRPESNSKIHRQ